MEREEKSQKEGNSGIYELGFLIVPTVSEEKIGDAVAEIKAVVEKSKGEILGEGAPTYINLAYPMKGEGGKESKMFSTAHFGWLKIEMPEASTLAFEESVSTNPKILRSMLISTVREDTFVPRAERVEEAPDFDSDARRVEKKESVVKVEERRDLSEEEEKELDEAIEELVE